VLTAPSDSAARYVSRGCNNELWAVDLVVAAVVVFIFQIWDENELRSID
jgi:hypothetical protein